MDEVTKIKKLKQQGGRGAARFRAIMLVLFLIAVVNFAPRFFSATPAPEPQVVNVYHVQPVAPVVPAPPAQPQVQVQVNVNVDTALAARPQSMYVANTDPNFMVAMGYQYYQNGGREIVRVWECGTYAVICHWNRPRIDSQQAFDVIWQTADGVVHERRVDGNEGYFEVRP